MTTRQKLLCAFGALALLVLFTALIGLRTASKASEAFQAHMDGVAARLELTNRVINATNARAIAARNMVLTADPTRVAAEKQMVDKAHAAVQDHMRQLQQQVASEPDQKGRELVAAIADIETKYGTVALNIVQKVMAGERDAAITSMNKDCAPLLASLLEAGARYLAYGTEEAHRQADQAVADYVRARWVLLTVLAVAVGAAIVLGTVLANGLTRALGAEPDMLSRVAQRIADGDLSPLTGAEQAPAGSVYASMAAMRGNLSNIVTRVRQGSDSVATASSQIAQGNQDLSGRTEQQASALQQTASSMDELGSTVRQNADNARQADQLARSASEVAQHGGTVVAEVVDTMKGINDSSRRIADIITVIDGIAFQTNILALNAAVEAARAGEQGRGFAVVAGEVRNLAQRSAGAAREIKGLITESVERVERGSALVDKAGATMQDVVASIRRVSDIVGEISSASVEQSNGVTQVGQAVTQMDRATQQNAALVEEAAAAASSLQQQAHQLVEVVAVFKHAEAV